jgi:hypothetical protein
MGEDLGTKEGVGKEGDIAMYSDLLRCRMSSEQRLVEIDFCAIVDFRG